MGTLLRSWRVAWALRRADADNRVLAREVTALRHSLEEERVKALLLQKEVDLLTQIHERDVARWRADTPAVREQP